MILGKNAETRLEIARIINRFMPPIVAHQIQEKLISTKEGILLSKDFKVKSIAGGFLRGNTKDMVAFKFSIHGYFDWRNIVLARHILNIQSGNVVEVGANIGTETLAFSKICRNTVYAFEPLPVNFEKLKMMKEENFLTNLCLEELIISNFSGRAHFEFPEESNSGTGHIVPNSDGESGNYRVVTLDEKLRSLESCSVIVIDVEGFELNVIEGASKLIQKFRPFLIIEVNENYLQKRANKSVHSLFTSLRELEYSCFHITKLGLKEIGYKNYTDSYNKNWLCIPEEKKEYKRSLSNSVLFNGLNPFINFIIL